MQIKGTSGNTKGYEVKKAKDVLHFFRVLQASQHKNIRDLALQVNDPETREPQFRLIILVRGSVTTSKMKVLNMSCCIFVHNLRMMKNSTEVFLDPKLSEEQKAKLRYAPSVISLKLRHLFAYFKTEGIAIEQRMMKSMPGSYKVS